jgi:S-adenosylmethionine:tRNA ribosyltransferase-isomerase
MHRERFAMPPETCQTILAAREAGRPVIAVGTTTVRALESWAQQSLPEGCEGWTDLFIHPPYAFRAVDGLITNFHQPASTLIQLVAAFHGEQLILAAYEEAIAREYRFFSYGDAMAILPGDPPGTSMSVQGSVTG